MERGSRASFARVTGAMVAAIVVAAATAGCAQGRFGDPAPGAGPRERFTGGTADRGTGTPAAARRLLHPWRPAAAGVERMASQLTRRPAPVHP